MAALRLAMPPEFQSAHGIGWHAQARHKRAPACILHQRTSGNVRGHGGAALGHATLLRRGAVGRRGGGAAARWGDGPAG